MSSLQSEQNSSGKIINLLANDGTRIEFSIFFAPYLFIGPIMAIVVLLYLIMAADYSILSGLLVLILTIPLQSFLGKLLGNIR